MATVTFGDNTGNTGSGTDCEITESGSTGNNDTSFYVVGETGNKRNALIKFDMSSVSGPVSVSAATLRIYLDDPGGATVNTGVLSLYRCLRNWVDSQATWAVYSTGNAWGTAGAANTSTDRSATISASATPGSTPGWISWTGAQLIADVESMINSGSNFGWVLPRSDGVNDNSFWGFRSDTTTDTLRPELEVTYTPVTPKSASDTASLSVTEGDLGTVDTNTLDTASLTVTETSSVTVGLARTDTTSLTLSESVNLQISNSSTPSASDTTSLTLTETAAVAVSITASDTASVSVTDASTVTPTLLTKTASDTVSLTVGDFAVANSVGTVEIFTGDVASLIVEDAAVMAPLDLVTQIRFTLSPDQIRFRLG